MMKRLTIGRGRQNTEPTKSIIEPGYSLEDSHIGGVPREVLIISSLSIFNTIEPLVTTS